MVKEVTLFQSEDGSLFKTIEEAVEHDARGSKLKIIRDYFNDENDSPSEYYVDPYVVYNFIQEYTKGWK